MRGLALAALAACTFALVVLAVSSPRSQRSPRLAQVGIALAVLSLAVLAYSGTAHGCPR